MRAAAAALVAAALVALAGCGSSSGTAGGTTGDRATVLAAASLTEAFPAIDPSAAFSFGGSDQLAFQIEQGAPADVVAVASPKYADALRAEGLVDAPRVFATNRVVVIVPRSNPAGIRSVRDLARPGVRLVVGDPGVPIGAYTERALHALGLDAALGNVVSRETDVKAVVAKVALGEADAGMAYRTDVRPAGDRIRALPVPAAAQPVARYEIAVVHDAPHRAAAEEFVRAVLGPRGRAELARRGFGLPPP